MTEDERREVEEDLELHQQESDEVRGGLVPVPKIPPITPPPTPPVKVS